MSAVLQYPVDGCEVDRAAWDAALDRYRIVNTPPAGPTRIVGYVVTDAAGELAARRLQRLERIGDAIEALIPAAAVVVAALLFVAMVMR